MKNKGSHRNQKAAPSPAAPAAGKRIRASRKVYAGTIFLTANTHKRIPIFHHPEACEIFFRELRFYRGKYGFKLYGHVLLPDHFHLLMWFPPDKSFRSFLRDFKSAVGHLVVDWAKQTRRARLLGHLLLPSASKRRRRDAHYRILQANSHVRPVSSESMFRQKLDYIHCNPVRAGLVEKAIDYPYSSLRDYEFRAGPAPVDRRDR